jgi:transcriptional regulator with XRE-family HTH domain
LIKRTTHLPTVGKILRGIRKSRGLTQKAFADDLETTIYVVSSLEGGRVPHVRLSRLVTVADLLGVLPSDLNPDAQELHGGSSAGRWSKPAIDEFGFSDEDAQEIIDSYERPKVRGDCLSSEDRYGLLAKEASRFGLPILDPDPIYGGDGKPDGINCARPCPFVSCKHHLYLDVSGSTGGLRVASDVNIEDMSPLGGFDLVSLASDEDEGLKTKLLEDYGPGYFRPSCALDIADSANPDKSTTLEVVGRFLGVTRERVRQIEGKAFDKIKSSESVEVDNLLDFLDFDDKTSFDPRDWSNG